MVSARYSCREQCSLIPLPVAVRCHSTVAGTARLVTVFSKAIQAICQHGNLAECICADDRGVSSNTQWRSRCPQFQKNLSLLWPLQRSFSLLLFR